MPSSVHSVHYIHKLQFYCFQKSNFVFNILLKYRPTCPVVLTVKNIEYFGHCYVLINVQNHKCLFIQHSQYLSRSYEYVFNIGQEAQSYVLLYKWSVYGGLGCGGFLPS